MAYLIPLTFRDESPVRSPTPQDVARLIFCVVAGASKGCGLDIRGLDRLRLAYPRAQPLLVSWRRNKKNE